MIMTSKTRLIDQEPVISPRPKEMKVLVLGLSKTSTMSMYTALEKLGYTPYHMFQAIKRPHTFYMWNECLEAKFLGKGKPWGRTDFDKLLGGFDATLDVPSAILPDELIAAYPNAKVILTNRDVNKWLTSWEKTVGEIWSWNWSLVAPFDSLVGPWYAFFKLLMTAWYPADGNLRKTYLDHYEHVRKITPEDRLLEHHPQDGWRPLCEFLGKPIPQAEDYPRVNDSAAFVNLHKKLYWMAFGKMMATTVGPVALAIGAGWYFRRNGFTVLSQLSRSSAV